MKLYNLLFRSFRTRFPNVEYIQSFHAKWAKLVFAGQGEKCGWEEEEKQRPMEKAYIQGGGTKQGICIQHLLRAVGGISFWIYLIGGY